MVNTYYLSETMTFLTISAVYCNLRNMSFVDIEICLQLLTPLNTKL
jgi:hypothetical protein